MCHGGRVANWPKPILEEAWGLTPTAGAGQESSGSEKTGRNPNVVCVSDPKEPQSTTAIERPPSPANSITAEGLFSLAAHSGPDHRPLTLTALCCSLRLL